MGLSQQLLHGTEHPYYTWHNLIESYSARQLTFESDKLPAVSGVASRIHEMTGSKYLAGLWRDNFPLELCWSVDYISSDSSKPQLLPNGFIAPSWSWASVNGALSFVDQDPETLFESLITILDAKCSVPGFNPYGEVTDGFLILRGLIVTINVNCGNTDNCWDYTVGENPESSETMAPDCMLVQCQINTATDSEKKTVRRARKGDILAPFSAEVYCIRLVNIEDEDSVKYGMLLGCSETEDNVYTRLGLVELDSEDWFHGATERTIKII
jgi:hypothetical protein